MAAAGPIYIHASPCERYGEIHRFPEDLYDVPVTLNAYATGRTVRAQERARGADVDRHLKMLFARDDIEYVHVRNSEAGCFIVEVARGPDQAD